MLNSNIDKNDLFYFLECFYSDNSYLDGNGNDLVTIQTATTGQCIDRCVQVSFYNA